MSREEVPLPARVVHLAQIAVLSGQVGGAAAAVSTVRGRRGRGTANAPDCMG
jgi:hypothetical protein